MSRSKRDSEGRQRASSSGVAARKADFQFSRNSLSETNRPLVSQNAGSDSMNVHRPNLQVQTSPFDEHTPIRPLSPELHSKLPEWMKLGLANVQPTTRATPAPQPATAVGYTQLSGHDRTFDGEPVQSLEEELASSRASMTLLERSLFDRNAKDRAASTAKREMDRSPALAGVERRSPTTAADLRLRSPDPMQDSSFTNGLLAKFSSTGSPTSSLSSQQSTPPPFSESSHATSPKFGYDSRVGLAELVSEREKYHAALVSKDKTDGGIKGLGCGSLSATSARQSTPPASGLDFGTGGRVRDALAALDRAKSVNPIPLPLPIPLAVPSHQPLPRSRTKSATTPVRGTSSRRKPSRTKDLRDSGMDQVSTSAFQPPNPSFSDLSKSSASSFLPPRPSSLPSHFPVLASPPSPQPSTVHPNQLGLHNPIFSSLAAPLRPDPLLFGSTNAFTADQYSLPPPHHQSSFASQYPTSFPSDYTLGLPMDIDPNPFGAKDVTFGGEQLQDFVLDDFLSSLPTTEDLSGGKNQNAFDSLYWGSADPSR